MAVTDIASYDNLLKEKFGAQVNLLPATDKLQKMIPFSKGNKVGKLYEENVDLEFEHGFTFTGNQAAPTLRGGQTAENENAQITPSGIVGQKVVGYRDFFRSEGAGENAFADAAKKRVTDLTRGTRRNIEISMLHGQSPNGIGVVSSLSGQKIYITAATWAPGIWAGAKNMPITVYQSNLTTLRAGSLNVSAVDPDDSPSPSVTVVGTTTGIVAGDVIFRDTAILGTSGGVFQEMVGIAKALRNTGTIWNIDGSAATGHMLWRPNTYAVNGRLTMGHILKATSKAVPKGLTNGCIVLIPTRAYEAMNEDQSALRVYDNSYAKEKLVNGVQALSFVGQAGEVTVVPHIYMMEGESFILPFEADMDPEDRGVKRIGSTDVAFGLPGDANSIVRHKDNQAAVEIRNFTDQALFINCLGRCTVMTGLAYT
jgi:hypothetical protein